MCICEAVLINYKSVLLYTVEPLSIMTPLGTGPDRDDFIERAALCRGNVVFLRQVRTNSVKTEIFLHENKFLFYGDIPLIEIYSELSLEEN